MDALKGMVILLGFFWSQDLTFASESSVTLYQFHTFTSEGPSVTAWVVPLGTATDGDSATRTTYRVEGLVETTGWVTFEDGSAELLTITATDIDGTAVVSASGFIESYGSNHNDYIDCQFTASESGECVYGAVINDTFTSTWDVLTGQPRIGVFPISTSFIAQPAAIAVSSSRNNITAVIVGCSVAGFIVICIFVFLFLWRRRHRQQPPQKSKSDAENISPFVTEDEVSQIQVQGSSVPALIQDSPSSGRDAQLEELENLQASQVSLNALRTGSNRDFHQEEYILQRINAILERLEKLEQGGNPPDYVSQVDSQSRRNTRAVAV
ncbi:hypothetical protein F5050DRAFT_1811140 [Lentinula boryana]|uniref:Uncharacterized protein n=1 Tax=Lentinula boryana TaxID=40481 RepID=A0ABQ8Q2C4_9AGAR|nr:hypothetical protein F5050DRAFT_1811140 [Lentinula boryana]